MNKMRDPVIATIALGANLGDAAQQVRTAMQSIWAHPDISAVAESDLYTSPAFQSDGPDYVNAVIQVDTTLTAPALWRVMANIEQQAGRERPYRWAPRTLDLDLIFYGSGQLSSAELTVPHPRWAERAFVVKPLAQIAPHLVTDLVLLAVRDQQISRLKVPSGS